MRVSLAAAALAVSLIFGTGAAAQNVDGQWYARIEQGGAVTEVVMVITRGTYVMNMQSTVPNPYSGIAQYFTGQSGTVTFYPPDMLRFVVEDWSPKQYLGRPMLKPPNSTVRIVRFDGTTLALEDRLCMTMTPSPACTTVYRRQ